MPEIMDYKKEYKDLYQPKTEASEIIVPAINFIMVDGRGNPNIEGGEYQQAVEILYSLTYTIKMSIKSGKQPNGYFEYAVPPLEGLWWLDDDSHTDFSHKDKYCWTSMIRQPEFVTEDVFKWACDEVKKKKPQIDVSKARFQNFEEGLCVQIMHIGPYDTEPQSIEKVEKYIADNNFMNDISTILPNKMIRRHHEIYLGDPRKTKPENLKTVLRHPVKRLEV